MEKSADMVGAVIATYPDGAMLMHMVDMKTTISLVASDKGGKRNEWIRF